MKVLALAAALTIFALGYATGRVDGHAFAGVIAAWIAGLLIGCVCAAIGFSLWLGSVETARAKAAHVEQEI